MCQWCGIFLEGMLGFSTRLHMEFHMFMKAPYHMLGLPAPHFPRILRIFKVEATI